MHYSVNKKSLVRVYLLPRYMCNIVQKYTMLIIPVEWRLVLQYGRILDHKSDENDTE